jgi:hypothetical protein
MKGMEKIDFKKELRQLYNPSAKEISIVDVPAMNFLLVDGEGAPTAPQYSEAIESLFSLSYTIKFMVKKSKRIDFSVMPLEGLWWVDDMVNFSSYQKDDWKWTAMIMQPKYVNGDEIKLAIEQVKKRRNLTALPKVRFESFTEGPAAQILYVGPFSAEGPTIKRIHDCIQNSGHLLNGKHHEIYLNNPATTAPEKLKTIIRQPMK